MEKGDGSSRLAHLVSHRGENWIPATNSQASYQQLKEAKKERREGDDNGERSFSFFSLLTVTGENEAILRTYTDLFVL